MKQKEYNEITDKTTGRKFKKITRKHVKGTPICYGCVFDSDNKTKTKEDLAVYSRMCSVQICPDNDKIFIEV